MLTRSNFRLGLYQFTASPALTGITGVLGVYPSCLSANVGLHHGQVVSSVREHEENLGQDSFNFFPFNHTGLLKDYFHILFLQNSQEEQDHITVPPV